MALAPFRLGAMISALLDIDTALNQETATFMLAFFLIKAIDGLTFTAALLRHSFAPYLIHTHFANIDASGASIRLVPRLRRVKGLFYVYFI